VDVCTYNLGTLGLTKINMVIVIRLSLAPKPLKVFSHHMKVHEGEG